MTPEEINTRMNILLGLRGFSIVKLTDKTALWRLLSDDELLIDVSFPSDLWEVKHKGKSCGIESGEIPGPTKNMIDALIEDFEAACNQDVHPSENSEEYQIESIEEPEEYPEDETPSRIKLSDEDLIKKLDEIIMTPGQTDKTLWVKL